MSVEVVAVDAAATRPLRQRVLRPHETLADLARKDEPPGVRHVAVFEEGEVVATGNVSPDPHPGSPAPGDWRIRGMAADPSVRGRGLGSAVLDALLAHAWSQGAARVWCNARSPAVGLYARAGFTTEGGEFEIDPIGPHYVMSLSAPR